MSGHVGFETLQDHREGLLPPDEQAAVRAHLVECSACRKESEALATLMAGIGELPLEAQPSRDLWPQIEWRLGSRGAPAGSEGWAGRTGPRRGVTLQAWQWLAAGLALAILSGGGVWAILSGGPGGGPLPVASVTAPAPLARPAGWESALDEYDQAVSDLEGVLALGRDVLDPETIGILEENLQAIDQAIHEAQEALSQDPGSKLLGRFLAENLRRKVELLRHAVTVVYANT